MGRGRVALLAVAATCLVTACSGGGGDEDVAVGSTPAGTVASETTAVIGAGTTEPVATEPPATVASTAATTATAPPTPAPTAATSPPPVATTPRSNAPRENCGGAPEPPAGAQGLQATFLDVDADERSDVVWLYDAPDGTHLHLRTGRGVIDDFVLGYGQGAVAVGAGQVDLAVGSDPPGTAQEILTVTADGDGRRLVGVYGFSIRSGCVEPFTFAQGNPFVYLVSRDGTLSGLRCVSDGVTGFLEGVTATPAGADAFATTRLAFERQGRRLVPRSSESATIPATDTAGLAAGQDVTGCTLSRPAF